MVLAVDVGGTVSGRKRNAISWAFAEAINELYLAVRRASDEERQALRAHIDSLTMTNCWWAEYEAAPVIRNALDPFEVRSGGRGNRSTSLSRWTAA